MQENEPNLKELIREREPDWREIAREFSMTEGERKIVEKLDPNLLLRAKVWWMHDCPEYVKSECSMWTILALFAQQEKSRQC